MIKIYHDPISTTSRPVMLFLAEHELPVEMIRIDLIKDEHKSADYAVINPNCQVPTLVDGDLAIGECSAILKYLADVAGSPAYPMELKARARVNSAMDWFNTGFSHDMNYRYVYPQFLPNHRWDNPLVQAQVTERGLDHARRRLTVLDRDLLGHGEDFLLGPSLTIADYLGACYLALSEAVDFDLSPWPRAAAWLDRMRARPAWGEVFAGFRGLLAAVREMRRAAG